MNRAKLQLWVVTGLLLLWAVGLIVATAGGSPLMLKILTPLVTTALGWLFTARATEA